MSNQVFVEPIGNTGRAFRIRQGNDIFDIRTTSSRRYLVVNLRGRWVEKRTDDIKVADRERTRSPQDRIVIDRSLYR